ncbi:uncharacterized protein LOC120353073 isoform X2 [Nilaparvata lugens]|uniref:uncharacterized protein LOC120353073 isoform X2 n=1 Tax=Nilaparvata lugens TaxID=108931 RepID=UPI00193D4325|nr:uncharacterized protein LOC120353073 isoform X2 [Nilaparvata lugens]
MSTTKKGDSKTLTMSSTGNDYILKINWDIPGGRADSVIPLTAGVPKQKNNIICTQFSQGQEAEKDRGYMEADEGAESSNEREKRVRIQSRRNQFTHVLTTIMQSHPKLSIIVMDKEKKRVKNVKVKVVISTCIVHEEAFAFHEIRRIFTVDGEVKTVEYDDVKIKDVVNIEPVTSQSGRKSMKITARTYSKYQDWSNAYIYDGPLLNARIVPKESTTSRSTSIGFLIKTCFTGNGGEETGNKAAEERASNNKGGKEGDGGSGEEGEGGEVEEEEEEDITLDFKILNK